MTWTLLHILFTLSSLVLAQSQSSNTSQNTSQKNSTEKYELEQVVIIFSEGISAPVKSDYSVDRNWIARVGYDNLHVNGKVQMRDLGSKQHKENSHYSNLIVERDVAIYTQDKNNSVIGSYFFAQGLFKEQDNDPSTPDANISTTRINEGSKRNRVLPTLQEESFMDVPIVSNHFKYDPVLMPFGPSCPNLLMEQRKFKDQVKYKEAVNSYSDFLTGFNKRLFADTRLTISTLDQATVFYEYLVAEKAITGSNEIAIGEADLANLRQIHSFYRFFEHFYNTNLQQSGAAMLLQQIKKDFSEKARLTLKIDKDRENLLRSNQNKVITAYSVNSATIANLMIVFNLTAVTCQAFNSLLNNSACLEWPTFGSHFRLELLRNVNTSEYKVAYYYDDNRPETVEPPRGFANLSELILQLDNYTMESFNSYCGAEWLIGTKAVQTFMGLVFLNIFLVSLAVMMLVIIVFMKAKINNLKQLKDAADGTEHAKIVEGSDAKERPLN